MTICIAGLAESHLVLASDTKVAFGNFSADKALAKNVPFIHHYAIMFAGNDVAHAGAVIGRAKQFLKQQKPVPSSPDEIAECVFKECQIERDRINEAKILKPRMLTMQEFSKRGKELCTDAVFYDISAELQRGELSLDFLIAGFDENKQAHIRFCNAVTPPQDYDSLGFWAIGSGASVALASLSHAVEYQRFSKFASAEVVACHVLAAKFMAEAASDVGRDTDLWVLACDSEPSVRFLSSLGAKAYIRRQWEQCGAPRMPNGLDRAMKDLLVANAEYSTTPKVLERLAKYCPEARKVQRTMSKQLASRKSGPGL